MFSSIVRAALIERTNARAQNNNPSMLHKPCTMYIGKEQYHISLVPLENILAPAWRKQRGFGQLETEVYSLKSAHQIVNTYNETNIDGTG